MDVSRVSEGNKLLNGQTKSSENSRKYDIEKIVTDPYNHIMNESGNERKAKQAKALFEQAMNHWFDIPLDKAVEIKEIVRMVYTAGLLFDDIQDGSELRGGISSAHRVYGIPRTMNSFVYAFALGMQRFVQLGHPDVITAFSEKLMATIRGTAAEIYHRDNFICPTEEEYKEIVKAKSTSFFHWIIELIQLFSNNKRDFSKFSGLMGLYHQIRDDYCNLVSEEYTERKGYCEDLSEGKFSFPVIHSIQSNPKDETLMTIIKQRPTDVETKKQAVEIMIKTGSFEYCKKTLKDLENQIREEMKRLGHNPFMIELMDLLSID